MSWQFYLLLSVILWYFVFVYPLFITPKGRGHSSYSICE